MRFIIGILIALGLLIFVFVLIFGHRGNSSTAAPGTSTKMIDYANSSVEVAFTNEGPVNADQNHREVRITVGSTESTLEVFQGYQKNLINSKSYPNNSAAYADFLRALDLAGYTKGNTDKSVADERGYCPEGNRYVMNIKDGARDIERFWSSSCGTGTFKGKTELVQNLFIKQIPDYDTLTNGVF